MKFFWFIVSFFSAASFGLLLSVWLDFRSQNAVLVERPRVAKWEAQSIDTMKYSRDLAREKKDNEEFDEIIDDTIRKIASAGATHAAIGTPYDEEFFPMLERWVAAARKYGLRVWFRGNWSGWENWFDYPPLSPAEHIAKTEDFIASHPEIFTDGDIFTACPECENGGPGDPRETGDTEGFRQFLIDEYEATSRAFEKINKRVIANYISQNGDVARLIMDKETTARLGGVITVDHYVETPAKLASDIGELALLSGGRVVIGELGVPIPDINGEMTQTEQADWLKEALEALADNSDVLGINYWLGTGGSSELWSAGLLRPAYYILREYYQSENLTGKISDQLGRPVGGVKVTFNGRTAWSGSGGYFGLRVKKGEDGEIMFESPGFKKQVSSWSGKEEFLDVTLIKSETDIWFEINKFRRRLGDYFLK